jgi:hypothetical protein
MRNRLIAPALALLVSLLAAGASVAAAPLAPVATSFGGVTVKATPGTLSGGTWEFQIAFDTHSQDLRDDVAKSASLVADGVASAPLEWRGDPQGGHHRKGVLRFRAPAARPAAIELRLSRPGEAEPRVFRWKLE